MKTQFKVAIVVVQFILVTIHTVTGYCTVLDFTSDTNSIKDCDSELKLNIKNWTSLVIPKDFINQTKFIHSIDVTEQHLQTISDKGFCGWNLTSIDAGKNDITSLPANVLVDCSVLEVLSLSNNNIDQINENAFQNLSLLYGLDLSYNKIEVFNGSVCKPLTSLNELILRNNKLKTITADMFDYILQLESLDVSNNSIANIREGLFLKKLTTLNISFNRDLKFINLTVMPQLEELIIEGAQLTQMNVTQNLRVIVANYNKISSIFIEQPNCMLEKFYLRNNSLQDVKWMPTSRINTLSTLDVSNNNISDFYSLLLLKTESQEFIISGNPIDFDVAEHTKILEAHLTLIKAQLNDLSKDVSDSRFMTNCTIFVFSLCIIFQIYIFAYQNRMRWNIPFPNVFGQTQAGSSYRAAYHSNQNDDYFPNLLD